MTNYADPNAFLMGGGAKSAKFDNEGDKVVGTIRDMQVKQQTDIKTGAPRTWDNGDPMMQLVVTLQTDARDDEDDDVYPGAPGSKNGLPNDCTLR